LKEKKNTSNKDHNIHAVHHHHQNPNLSWPSYASTTAMSRTRGAKRLARSQRVRSPVPDRVEDSALPSSKGICLESLPDPCRNTRRRHPRVNGADIYVARVLHTGFGTAHPCWRCVQWCRWAGVRRIFHWDDLLGKFKVVKVGEVQREGCYVTSTDKMLSAGLVSILSLDLILRDRVLKYYCRSGDLIQARLLLTTIVHTKRKTLINIVLFFMIPYYIMNIRQDGSYPPFSKNGGILTHSPFVWDKSRPTIQHNRLVTYTRVFQTSFSQI
jgi:hypothetical protein